MTWTGVQGRVSIYMQRTGDVPVQRASASPADIDRARIKYPGSAKFQARQASGCVADTTAMAWCVLFTKLFALTVVASAGRAVSDTHVV